MCCMKHDLCYDKAIYDGDCYDTAEEYMLPYSWKCVQGQSICLNHGNFSYARLDKLLRFLE